METIAIPKSEYMQMQQAITTLQQQLNLAQDGEFIKKMMLAYQVFVVDKPVLPMQDDKRLPLQYGAGKHVITYMADDFDVPFCPFER